MALVGVQSLKIGVAGAGIAALCVLMGHLSYSGAQRHRDQRNPEDYRQNASGDYGEYWSRERDRVRDRARELRDALWLSDNQYRRVRELLEEYGYAYRRSEWREKQEGFYSELSELLDESQRERLAQWREGVRQRMVDPMNWRDGSTGSPDTPATFP